MSSYQPAKTVAISTVPADLELSGAPDAQYFLYIFHTSAGEARLCRTGETSTQIRSGIPVIGSGTSKSDEIPLGLRVGPLRGSTLEGLALALLSGSGTAVVRLQRVGVWRIDGVYSTAAPFVATKISPPSASVVTPT